MSKTSVGILVCLLGANVFGVRSHYIIWCFLSGPVVCFDLAAPIFGLRPVRKIRVASATPSGDAAATRGNAMDKKTRHSWRAFRIRGEG